MQEKGKNCNTLLAGGQIGGFPGGGIFLLIDRHRNIDSETLKTL